MLVLRPIIYELKPPSVHHLESMPFQINWHEISKDKQKIYENGGSASFYVCVAHGFNFQNSR
jgi:hypothetical protein